MEAIRRVGLSVDCDDWVVHVKWVGFTDEETNWELLTNSYAEAPQYLVSRLNKIFVIFSLSLSFRVGCKCCTATWLQNNCPMYSVCIDDTGFLLQTFRALCPLLR